VLRSRDNGGGPSPINRHHGPFCHGRKGPLNETARAVERSAQGGAWR
jgi:hypothetical protein